MRSSGISKRIPAMKRACALLAPLLALVPACLFADNAGSHISLFNGHSLAGWHTQGDCQWSVVGGAIRGVNPNGRWCHLVTDSSYADYSLDLDYRIVKGNTGLYVRAGRENTQCCGIEGTQVDIGPSQDGSVMWVTEGAWAWYELITKAVSQGWVDYSKWNTLRVDVKGMGIKTFVNGHAVYASENLAKMASKGTLALQLHDGGKGDTILFRNLELYLPMRIPGCLDSTMVEYNPNANFAAKDSCKTRKVTAIGAAAAGRTSGTPGNALIANLPGSAGFVQLVLPAGFRRLELYDSQGRMVWAYAREDRTLRQILGIPGHIGAGIFRCRWVD